MGNCISKISKDLFLNIEEYFKNKTFLEKGKIRRGLDIITGGDTQESILYSEPLAPLQAGAWWKNFF